MSKTGEQVRKNVYAITRFTDAKFDEELTAEDAFLIAINEALRELADKGLLFGSSEVIVPYPSTYYDLPEDCTVILSVVTSGGMHYTAWQVDGNKITCADADVFTINYRAYPTEVTALTATLPYREMYFTAICDYVKYWMYTFDDEESKVAQVWYQKFLVGAQQAYTMLNKNHRPCQMQVQRTRGGNTMGGIQMGSGTSGSNVLAQVMAAVGQVETLKTEAVTEITTLKNKISSTANEAVAGATASAALSRRMANEPENTEIEPGVYSALHYAKKAEAWSESAKKEVYGYATAHTGNLKVGYWFKMFTVVLRQQNDDISGYVSLLGGRFCEIGQGKALLWFRIKQEKEMGSEPLAALQLLGGANDWITPNRVRAVVTNNTLANTEVTFYVCIPNNYTDVGCGPLHLHWPSTADVSVVWTDSDGGVAELPTGAQISCEYMGLKCEALPVPGGSFKNLKIQVTSNTALTLTADALTVGGTDGLSTRLSNVSLTILTGISGASGIDAGTLAANTWYAVWVIYNPGAGTVAGLLSSSATAPTLPSGYNYVSRFGWVNTNASGYLYRTVQYGRQVQYIVDGTVLTSMRVIGSGALGTYSATAPTWSTVPVRSVCVPPTASEVDVVAYNYYKAGSLSMVYIAPNSNYTGHSSTIGNIPLGVVNNAGVATIKASITLENDNLYLVHSAAGGVTYCAGWHDNL